MSDLTQLSDEQLLARIQEAKRATQPMQTAPLPEPPQQAAPKPPQAMTDAELVAAISSERARPILDRFPELRGAGNAVDELRNYASAFSYGWGRTAAGARELVPEKYRNAIDTAGANMNLAAPPSTDVQQWEAARKEFEPAMQKYPGMRIAEAGPMLFATSPAAMAAFAALRLNTPRDRIIEGVSTYLMAKAFDLGARGLSKVLAGREQPPEMQMLLKEGVTPTPGQMLGKKAAEEKLTSAPIIGEEIKQAQARAIQSFNRTTYRRALAGFGDEGKAIAESAPAGREGVMQVGDFLSNQYNKALDASVPTTIDGILQDEIIRAGTKVPPKESQTFLGIIKENIARPIQDTTGGAGTITPQVAKQIESDIGTAAQNYVHSSSASERDVGKALLDVQRAVRDAVARSNPETGPLIQKINGGWAQLAQIERAAATPGATGGVFTPKQYIRSLRAGEKSIRHRAFARGEVPNQQFAEAADKVLSSVVADSGTAPRAAMLATLYGMVRHPVRTTGLLAAGELGMLPYSNLGQKFIADLTSGAYAPTASQSEIFRQLMQSGGGLLGYTLGQKATQ